MICQLLAYDTDGRVIAILDQLVQLTDNGVGMVDFEAHEAAGGSMQDIWNVERAAGSGTWPEWLGMRAHEFRVRVDRRSAHPIRELIHLESGHRRQRAQVEAAVAERIAQKKAEAEARTAEQVALTASMPLQRDKNGRFLPRPVIVVAPEPADIRDLIGGPGRPLRLTDDGRTALWVPPAQGIEPNAGGRLPIIGPKGA